MKAKKQEAHVTVKDFELGEATANEKLIDQNGILEESFGGVMLLLVVVCVLIANLLRILL